MPDWQAPPGEQLPQLTVWPQLLAGLLPQVREPQLGGVQATHVPLVQVSLDWHEPQLMV